MSNVRLMHGDCLSVLPTLESGSVDAICTDPPYGLEFMGKEWDSFDRSGPNSFEHSMQPGWGHGTTPLPRHGTMGKAAINRFQEWCVEWAAAALRVLKPAGYALIFGGTRTYHRMACAVEDAGFEIRDCIMWLYGSGFPKGKGCLKPAYEPILLCRKPGKGVLPLEIDACRVGTVNGDDYGRTTTTANGRLSLNRSDGYGLRDEPYTPSPAGRWPANVVLSYPEDEYIMKSGVTAEQKRELFRWLHENPE